MIEQVSKTQQPMFTQYSVALIAIIQKDLRTILNQQGFHSEIFLHDMDEADLFIFKLHRDYFWLYVFRTIQQDQPVTFVETTCMGKTEDSIQRLFQALNISLDGLEVLYNNFEIQYISIQNQLNLQ